MIGLVLQLSLLLPATSTGAWAADSGSTGDVDVELFHPEGDGAGYLGLPGAGTLGHLQGAAGLHLNYETDPVVLEVGGERVHLDPSTKGNDGDGVVDDRLTGELVVGFGLFGAASLVVGLPVVLFQDGTQLSAIGGSAAAPLEAGLGDIRVTPKLVALDRREHPVGLAFLAPVGLPTGKDGAFIGGPGFSVAPSGVLELSTAPDAGGLSRLRSAVELGYQAQPAARLRDLRLGSGPLWGAGFGYRPHAAVEVLVEARGRSQGAALTQSPAELLIGSRLRAGELVTVQAGGGTGLLPGVGAPDWRAVFGVTVAPNFDPASRDTDKDGVADGVDRCKAEPEDLDGFQDKDGCAELDNDQDGIADAQDECPMNPEDDDQFMDNDGCPEEDNDKDGVKDPDDRCMNDPETQNAYMDEDGCPDDVDKDSDGDRYADSIDRCPYDAEDYDGDKDEDGCPDEGRVVVGKDKIKINDVIYFDTGKDSIQARSDDLLSELAAVIVAHPELKKLRIEGHTDDVGNDALNLKLSDKRARSVMSALVSRGVEAGRLDARGFGEMYPLAPNTSEEGRSQNRRVEFVIVDRDE